MPSSWHRMIRLSAEVYKKLIPGQKIKLVDMGVLPPDFERELLVVFNTYIPQELQSQPLQQVLKKKSQAKVFPYDKYHDILKMIKTEEILTKPNPFFAFKHKLDELMKIYHPELKISRFPSEHPNYPFFNAEWKRIHKILVPPKK
jgi:hypothetical protein